MDGDYDTVDFVSLGVVVSPAVSNAPAADTNPVSPADMVSRDSALPDLGIIQGAVVSPTADNAAYDTDESIYSGMYQNTNRLTGITVDKLDQFLREKQNTNFIEQQFKVEITDIKA